MYLFIGCKFNERFSLFSFSGAIYLHKLSLKKILGYLCPAIMKKTIKVMNYIKCACCTLFSLLFTLTVSSGCKEKDMSMKMNEPRNIKGVISYKRSFGDLNDTHLSAAKRIGIRPLASRTEAEGLGGKLVEVAPCERYAMDSLTHSIPFWCRKPVHYWILSEPIFLIR